MPQNKKKRSVSSSPKKKPSTKTIAPSSRNRIRNWLLILVLAAVTGMVGIKLLSDSQAATNSVSYTATFAYQNIGVNNWNGSRTDTARLAQDLKNKIGTKGLTFYNLGEVNESAEYQILRNVFGRKGWTGLGTHNEPIFSSYSRDKWELTSEYTKLYSARPNGLALTPPGILVITKLVNKHTGAKLAVINTHWLLCAYDGNDCTRFDKRNRNAERRAVWDQAWRHLDRRVTRLHNHHYDVVIAADFNRKKQWDNQFRSFSVGGPRVVRHSGGAVDDILVVPAKGHRVNILRTGSFPTADAERFHPAAWARISFSYKK